MLPWPWTNLDKPPHKLSGQIPKPPFNLQIDGCVSESGGSPYRGLKLPEKVNNKSYIIFINIHDSNCLNLHQNKATL